MMELSEIESPIKEHQVAPSDGDNAFVVSASASPSAASQKHSDPQKPTDWWSFIKANVPSILSILSVLTNVIILSALIPSMKQDIAYMQGQASSLQNSTSSLIGSTIGIQQQVSTTQGNMQLFNAQFNSTLAKVAATDASVTSAQETVVRLLGQISILQVQVQQLTTESLNQIQTLNSTVQSQFFQLLSAYSQEIKSAETQLQSHLDDMQSLRDQFVNHTVPDTTAALQAFNQSGVVSALSSKFLSLNASVSNQTAALTSLSSYVSQATSFYGFQLSGVTVQSAQDPSASGAVLQFTNSSEDFRDTTGSYNYVTNEFTVPRAGTWRFQVSGFVAPTGGGTLDQSGLVLGGRSCSRRMQSIADYSPNLNGSPGMTPYLYSVLFLQVGDIVTICGWAHGNGVGGVQFGVTPAPGNYGKAMVFSGEYVGPTY